MQLNRLTDRNRLTHTHTHTHIHIYIYREREMVGSSCQNAKVRECGLEVSEFELQSHFYVHFRTHTLGKGTNSLSLQL